MNSLYLSRPVLACFDDEPPAAGPVPVPAPGPAPSPQGYVAQSDVNRILADDRRRHQAKIDAIQKSLAETLESKNLSARERETLSEQLEQLEAQKRTAEEQATHEKKQLEKQYQKQLADEKKEREQWEKRYKRAQWSGPCRMRPSVGTPTTWGC